ncbi:MAG: magnesium/cobalt transporter CorA [Eubacteriales bacterium]|nr:magnesium/cobalt transporter CorA [Eubacteriales bacterium]
MAAHISIWKIGSGGCIEISQADLAAARAETGHFVWIDITESPDQHFLDILEKQLGLHEIALDNLFDNLRNPRLLEFDDHLLLGARVLNKLDHEMTISNLGVVLSKDFVLTAHDEPLSILDRTLQRVKANSNQVQSKGSDRLLYLILDTLVDDYYFTLDHLSEAIDDIDDRATQLTHHLDRDLQHDILDTKRQLLAIHRAVSPLRDALLNLRRTNRALIHEASELYLRDVFEHILQLLDTVETYREILSSTTELIMTAASNRMNEIITFLTVFSTFFFPINFITSYYGMNLVMPEAKLGITYPIVIALMGVMIALMFIWFKRKKWL